VISRQWRESEENGKRVGEVMGGEEVEGIAVGAKERRAASAGSGAAGRCS